MNNAAERWRPILLATIETHTAEEATDTVIALIPLIMRDSVAEVAPSPTKRTRAGRQKRARQAPSNDAAATPGPPAKATHTSQILNTTGATRPVSSSRSTPAASATPPAAEEKTPPDPHRPMLDNDAFYSVDEAARYLGVRNSNIYNMMSLKPDRFPHQREPKDHGGTRLKLLGRGLNKDRIERDKRERQRQHGFIADNPDHSPVTDGSDPDVLPGEKEREDLTVRDDEREDNWRSSNGSRTNDP